MTALHGNVVDLILQSLSYQFNFITDDSLTASNVGLFYVMKYAFVLFTGRLIFHLVLFTKSCLFINDKHAKI